MADVYPVFSTEGINSQVTFNFGATAYAGVKPLGYVNFNQSMSAADVFGGLSATEASDTCLFSGGITIAGNLATIEVRDTALFGGIISDPPLEIFPAYSSEGIDSQVTFNFTPVSRPFGYLQWDLGPFTAYGPLAVTEATDTAVFNGIVVTFGTLAATEAADVAVFGGSLPAADMAGNLVYTEPSDTAVFNGAVTDNVGSLDAAEAPDVAEFTGNSGFWEALLNATENPDSAIFVGELGAAPSEERDTAAFIGYVMDTPPVPGEPEVLNFGIPVSLSRW